MFSKHLMKRESGLWGRDRGELMLHLVEVSRAFGIGVGTQLVQIQTLALGLRNRAIANEAVQNPVGPVDEGENKSEERSDSHKLSQDLIRLSGGKSGEQSGGEQSPEAGDAVDRSGAGRVVDAQAQLEPFDAYRNQRAADNSHDESRGRGKERRASAGGNQAGHPSICAEGSVGP